MKHNSKENIEEAPALPDSPVVKVIVHRGTDAIGGTCIEIATESGRLILDLGMPLMANGGGDVDTQAIKEPTLENGMLCDVEGLFDGQSEVPIRGVLLSHAHPDHYGLLNHVHPSIPIYMSEESKALIEVGNIFYGSGMTLEGVTERCQTFGQHSHFSLGEFGVTPHLIDHSAFGAYSFLINAYDRRLLYTGDLRGHGRKAYTFDTLPEKISGKVDCMLMEGTTLGGRHREGYDSEDAVEAGFVEHFAKDGATFVLAAGSNVDRLVSLYRACKRTGKTMVIDLYQYYLLQQLQQFSSSLPPHDGDHLRVFFERGQLRRLEALEMTAFLDAASPRAIKPGEMIRKADKMVIRVSQYMQEKLARKMGKPEEMRFIYSMWQGYLDKDARGKTMAAMPRQFGQEWIYVHTSGHAWLEDLQKLVKSISPDKLVPIHTLQGDSFAELFDNVVRIGDGDEEVL